MGDIREGFDSEQKSALTLFGDHLRRLRLVAGLTQEACAAELGYSAQHLGNLEAGRRMPQEAFVHAAERLLSGRELLLGMWRLAKDQATPGAQFEGYVDAEARAVRIRSHQSHLVPGLLQHRDYVSAVVASTRPPLAPAEIDARVALRLSRQEILASSTAPALWAVVGEAVLEQEIGGPTVRRAQLAHLLRLTARHNVTLQVLPFKAPTSPSMGMGFTLLSFTGESDIVYLDTLTGGQSHQRDTEAVSRYRDVFDFLREAALPETDSVALIERRLEECA